MLYCNMMIRSLRYVATEARDIPMYDRLTSVDEFLDKFERKVPEQQKFNALNWALHATPARWWGTHQQSLKDWHECKRVKVIQFGKPQLWMRFNFEGKKACAPTFPDGDKRMVRSPHECTPLSRLKIGRNNKQKQERRNAPKIICREAFSKVCDVLNKVHQVKRTNWDLRVPMVRWAYRTLCKTLTTREVPKLQYEVGTKIFEEDTKPNLHVTSPIDQMVREAQNEEITWHCEAEHIRLQEEIRQGNVRLCELEKYCVWLS